MKRYYVEVIIKEEMKDEALADEIIVDTTLSKKRLLTTILEATHNI